MPSFFQYLLKLFSGYKQWHVLVLVVLSIQLVVPAWFLHQQREQCTQNIEQLFDLNALSASMTRQAVAISQLQLGDFEKLALSTEHYQQKLDVLRPVFQQNASISRQTFKHLNDIWQPIRGAATDLLALEKKLQRLRVAVEDTDQRLPDVLLGHDRIIDALRAVLNKPASLRLLNEQRLIVQRIAANTNAATASVLSAVDANARTALSGSIEADLFLLEKSLGIMVSDNKEVLAGAREDGSNMSLLREVDALAERLTELAESIREVVTSLPVMRDINEHAQLLIEDGGLLVKPVQQLIADQMRAIQGWSKVRLWLYVSIAALLLWLFYVSYCRSKTLYGETLTLAAEKESLQAGVDGIARQMASFSEGDHAITVRSESIECQRLVAQANRMIAYVDSLDKQIEKNFLPLVKRVSQAKAEMVATIDRQANDIARLSVELNNVVSGQTSSSTALTSQLVQMQTRLQSMRQQIDAAKQQLPRLDDCESADASVHAVRQLRQHIDDRLRSLAELSQRINLDVVEVSASLMNKSAGDRALRRAIESVQSLTGRYQGQVNDVAQLFNDLALELGALIEKTERVESTVDVFERLQSDVTVHVENIDQGVPELVNAIASIDRAHARHTEVISLMLDELQDSNQRLSVAAVDSDAAIKQLDKLVTAQVDSLKRANDEGESDIEAKP